MGRFYLRQLSDDSNATGKMSDPELGGEEDDGILEDGIYSRRRELEDWKQGVARRDLSKMSMSWRGGLAIVSQSVASLR